MCDIVYILSSLYSNWMLSVALRDRYEGGIDFCQQTLDKKNVKLSF